MRLVFALRLRSSGILDSGSKAIIADFNAHNHQLKPQCDRIGHNNGQILPQPTVVVPEQDPNCKQR